jgi:putative transposase
MTRPLFRNRYRVSSARMPAWDYSAPGMYFVTLCVKDRRPCLGEVMNGVVRLSAIGEIVAEEWIKTEQIRPYVTLDAWVIMPNHLHGMIGITASEDDVVAPTETSRDAVVVVAETPRVVVGTPRRGVPTAPPPQTAAASAAWKSKSLGAIIGQFKSVCTKRIWAAGYRDFAWQPRFHDHIVRNEREWERIRAYILANPSRWEQDKENMEALEM